MFVVTTSLSATVVFLVSLSTLHIANGIQNIPAGPVKSRNCTEHRHQYLIDSENLGPNAPHTWEPKCLSGGIYAPMQFNHKSGLKFCVSKEGVILVSPQRSLADCDCPRRRFEKFQSGSFEGYIHRCDTDFTFSVQQFDPATNSTTCLIKDAEVIPTFSGPHVKACKCPRQWHEAKTSSLPNRYGPQCNQDGTFKPKQCHLGRCWCANSEGEQISAFVAEAKADSLIC